MFDEVELVFNRIWRAKMTANVFMRETLKKHVCIHSQFFTANCFSCLSNCHFYSIQLSHRIILFFFVNEKKKVRSYATISEEKFTSK